MKKILYLSNAPKSNLSLQHINTFNLTAYKAALSLGLEYHGNSFCSQTTGYYDEEKIHLHLVQIYRNPFSWDVIVAYRQLIKLLREEHFDIIHCNTPIGGFLGRVCGKIAKVPKIIYQAHGLHFYKCAPLLNWLLYYPIERWLAHYTDVLITINSEDYQFVKSKFHLRKNGKVYYVPGVGIDLSLFNPSIETRQKKRKELGLNEGDVVLISAGRLDKNKNNETTLRALARTRNVKLLLCGDGDQKDYLLKLSKSLCISDRVKFLGNRSDILELYQAADIFVLSSFREGLSRSIMEAMASGLPCIVSNIRGNVDLIQEEQGGFLFPPTNAEILADKINILAKTEELRRIFSEFNLCKIKNFSTNDVVEKLREIYTEL